MLALHRTRRDGYVHLWNLRTRTAVAEIPDQPKAVYGVTFAAGGLRLIVTTGDGLRFWETSTGQELLTLSLGQSLTHGLALAPDGKVIAVTDARGNLLLVDGEFRPHTVQRQLAFERQDESRLLRETQQLAAAREALDEALTLRERIVDAEPDSSRFRQELITALDDLAELNRRTQKQRETDDARRRANDLRQRLGTDFSLSQAVKGPGVEFSHAGF
jgi:hypothetical protein